MEPGLSSSEPAETSIASDRLARSDGASLRRTPPTASEDCNRREPGAPGSVKLARMRIYRIARDGVASYARASAHTDDTLELLSAAPWEGGTPTGLEVSRHRRAIEDMVTERAGCTLWHFARGNPDAPLESIPS